MNQYKHAPAFVRIRTILIIILSALLTSAVFELILTERTNALILETLQDTTSTVKQVLAPVLPPTPAPTQNIAPQTQPTSPKQNNSGPLAPTPVQNVPSEAPAASRNGALPPISNDLQKIYFSKAKMSESTVSARQASATSGETTLSSFSWLQATDQGWKLFGLLWYWWVIGVASVVGVTALGQRGLTLYVTYKWLSKPYIYT